MVRNALIFEERRRRGREATTRKLGGRTGRQAGRAHATATPRSVCRGAPPLPALPVYGGKAFHAAAKPTTIPPLTRTIIITSKRVCIYQMRRHSCCYCYCYTIEDQRKMGYWESNERASETRYRASSRKRRRRE